MVLLNPQLRFRVFAYSEVAEESWPRGDGSEITIGAQVDGKVVEDIIWTVHVANKKANPFVLMEAQGSRFSGRTGEI
jgi:hypothetical protein